MLICHIERMWISGLCDLTVDHSRHRRYDILVNMLLSYHSMVQDQWELYEPGFKESLTYNWTSKSNGCVTMTWLSSSQPTASVVVLSGVRYSQKDQEGQGSPSLHAAQADQQYHVTQPDPGDLKDHQDPRNGGDNQVKVYYIDFTAPAHRVHNSSSRKSGTF